MITEKDLDEMRVRADKCLVLTTGLGVKELIELAYLGLWARDVARPALEEARDGITAEYGNRCFEVNFPETSKALATYPGRID